MDVTYPRQRQQQLARDLPLKQHHMSQTSASHAIITFTAGSLATKRVRLTYVLNSDLTWLDLKHWGCICSVQCTPPLPKNLFEALTNCKRVCKRAGFTLSTQLLTPHEICSHNGQCNQHVGPHFSTMWSEVSFYIYNNSFLSYWCHKSNRIYKAKEM